MFMRTVATGLSNTTIKHEFKLFLEKEGIKDKELIDALNKIIPREPERQNKFANVKSVKLGKANQKTNLKFRS